jgi:hypothetical protein
MYVQIERIHASVQFSPETVRERIFHHLFSLQVQQTRGSMNSKLHIISTGSMAKGLVSGHEHANLGAACTLMREYDVSQFTFVRKVFY